MVLPFIAAILGSTAVKTAAATVGGTLLASKLAGGSSGANAAAAQAGLSQQQVDELITRLKEGNADLRNDAAYNRAEGDNLMAGFAKAIQSQLENQGYLLGRNATNDALSLEGRDYQRGYDATNQDTLNSEYASRYAQLIEDRRAQANERSIDLANKSRILAATKKMRDDLNRALSAQGTLTAPTLYGASDVDAEAAKRSAIYTKALDQLSDRAMSANEAALIRRGMDANGSGDSVEQRAEMVKRLAPEYQKAVSQAEAEAQQLVGARNQNLTSQYELLKDQRSRALQEIMGAGSAGLDIEASLNPAITGILSRDVGSASYRPSTETGINTNFVNPGYLDPATFGQLASHARGRTTTDYSAAIQALSAALGGASDTLRTNQAVSQNAGEAAGALGAQNASAWGNLFSKTIGAVLDKTGTAKTSAGPYM